MSQSIDIFCFVWQSVKNPVYCHKKHKNLAKINTRQRFLRIFAQKRQQLNNILQ